MDYSTSSEHLSMLAGDNAYFKHIIDIVPSAFYFDKETKEKIPQPAVISDNNGKQEKRKRPKELSDRAKAKRAKYDPDQVRTVTKLQEMLLQKEQGNKKNKEKNKTPSNAAQLKSSVESVDDLREKLQRKIDLMREKRSGGKIDLLERKKMKRRESKLKLRMRRDKEKKKKSNDDSHKGKGAVQNGTERPKAASPPPGKPIFNKEGKMVYSKFDFSEKNKKEEGGSKKNYKKLLEKVEKERSDIKKLKESDIDAAHTKAQKSAWKNALQKAEGMKVKDDPELLKKTIKKQEQIKKKSSKEWTERTDKLDKKQKEKQDKRQKNIKARKQKKVDTKIKKAKKKGRILPGF